MLNRNQAVALFAFLVAGLLSVSVFAGHVEGPKFAFGEKIAPNSSLTYDVSFNAGELAEVVVDGRGYTDLDLYIYDENGNLVASDTDLFSFCYASVTPQWTGQFTIEVRNIGAHYNWFNIETN